MPPREFNRRMQKIVRNIAANGDRIGRAAMTAFITVAVENTPVSTGRARSNWAGSIGAPVFLDVIPETPLGEGEASSIALGRTLAAISVWRATTGAALFITNGVPYIGSLDDGSSAKAPAGMSSLGLIAAQAVIARGRLLGRR